MLSQAPGWVREGGRTCVAVLSSSRAAATDSRGKLNIRLFWNGCYQGEHRGGSAQDHGGAQRGARDEE